MSKLLFEIGSAHRMQSTADSPVQVACFLHGTSMLGGGGGHPVNLSGVV